MRNPQWLQALGYAAADDRRIFDDIFTEGVVSSGAFQVTQRGAGANQSVDVAAGSAYVTGDDTTFQGKYRLQNDATVNAVVAAAHASLPRIDIAVVRVRDSQYGTGGDDATIMTIAGTPTSGATLGNRLGAPALPNSNLYLADILVPAASTQVLNANIADKRVFSSIVPTGAPVTIPPGSIFPYAGAAAPTGFVLCNGATYDGTQAAYLALWGVIGTTYGGAGQSSFAVPDLQGRVPAGLGTNTAVNARGKSDGVAVGSRSPLHSHTWAWTGGNRPLSSAGGGVVNYAVSTSNFLTIDLASIGITGGSVDAPAYLVVNYIIKL